jgi:dTDP-4-dehydrorhamnose reductase
MVLRPLEVWGGLECTVARIGNAFRDQIAETGHLARPGDLEAVRALGLQALRYPVLWETVAPDHPDECDWIWPDERLDAMRSLGLRPIVGLLHHGSGPRYTSLLDPTFPDLLARHAERVAERYPWLDRFTPVNEPLTTARFSALYGHWYPHAASPGPFLRAVVTQCKATVLAMRAIRRVSPAAQLIQTEDIGRTFSTPTLAGQAEFENDRRWLSLDLLYGKVDRHHPWHDILIRHGASRAELDLFLEGDAAPDLIGVNHYLTSERYLDERLGRYPAHLHGSNGRQTYADAEAVRMPHLAGLLGPGARLREVWTRYGRPIAVTEVHHGCTREEQLRWLAEVWAAAEALRPSGVDIRAVTVWALFGAFDWNSLLTERRASYEPGAFDIRAPQPRPTALAKAGSDLARTGRFDHPVLDARGWWHRPDRSYGAPRAEPATDEDPGPGVRSLLVTGASRPLARVFARICAIRGLRCVRAEKAAGLDEEQLARANAWAVVDTGIHACSGIGECEAGAAQAMARACARQGLPFVAVSSDRVFDGRLGRPYDEADAMSPADGAGSSAALHEERVRAVHPEALIVRSGLLLDAWDGGNEGVRLLAELARGGRPILPDMTVSPAFAPDLAHAVLDLLIDGETGTWHLPNAGAIHLRELPDRLAHEAGWTRAGAAPMRTPEINRVLVSRRGWPMPSLEDALARFVRDARFEQQLNAALAAE